jgi:cyclic beta-1,2-glucan synthetase
VQATELLLQERTPRDVAVARPPAQKRSTQVAENVRDRSRPMLRRFHSPTTPTPRTHLLSNGRYVGDAHGSGLRLQPLGTSR